MLITLFCCLLNYNNPVNNLQNNPNDPTINWSEKKLTFNDFKGKPKTTKGVEGELATKITWTIAEETGKTPVYTIYNKMVQNQSWMSIQHEELLKEYQFIWNLSELYTRKIRKEVESLYQKKTTNKEVYKAVITKNVTIFHKERMKLKGTLQNQPDLYKILDQKYQDSLKIYQKYKQ